MHHFPEHEQFFITLLYLCPATDNQIQITQKENKKLWIFLYLFRFEAKPIQ